MAAPAGKGRAMHMPRGETMPEGPNSEPRGIARRAAGRTPRTAAKSKSRKRGAASKRGRPKMGESVFHRIAKICRRIVTLPRSSGARPDSRRARFYCAESLFRVSDRPFGGRGERESGQPEDLSPELNGAGEDGQSTATASLAMAIELGLLQDDMGWPPIA